MREILVISSIVKEDLSIYEEIVHRFSSFVEFIIFFPTFPESETNKSFRTDFSHVFDAV